ncbi:MAG: Protein kinase [Microgenomates group bacterium GW2011_GWA2_40_6]|nr:MAG: Protein kinase [Microgenomates group bacterium GW2011_GWA2_40_6]
MAQNSNQKSFLVIVSVLSVVISLTYLISILARGYQPDFNDGFKFKATGLLSATSKPKSASVFINGQLYTATDDTINLSPGKYQVKIIKDGYQPWSKNVEIQKEMVVQTEATLFRSAPDFSPITQNGALNPTVNLDKNSLVFSVSEAGASKDNGIYLIETYSSPLPLGKNTPKQIIGNFPSIDWSNYSFTFSPNSKQILAISHTQNTAYLLNLETSGLKKPTDVSNLITFINNDWQKQRSQILLSKLERLPAKLRPLVATQSADILFSEDDSKALYLSQKGPYLVYDLKKDINYPIGNLNEIDNPFWLPNSNNLVYSNKSQQIKTVEYDGSNQSTIFAGKFSNNLILPWSDGSKIIVYTRPFPEAPENLYSVSIR